MGDVHALSKRPLYMFDLPSDILGTLQLKQLDLLRNENSSTSPEIAEERENASTDENSTSKATSCALCGLFFENLQEQRSHVRSDLHGYNLKQKMRGAKVVSEQEFEKLVGDLNESLSGSETSDSSSSSDDDLEPRANNTNNLLSDLLKKQATISSLSDGTFSSKKRKRGAGKPPLLWFSSSNLPSNTSLGIYRVMFKPHEQSDPTLLIDALKHKQLKPAPPPQNPTDGGVSLPKPEATPPHIFLCMIGGGHFAAMIVSLAPKSSKKQGQGTSDERQATVLAHKTFHRYTTRRKQGGAQSANDSAKGAAHSAGSSLRRYNETALVSEVRGLLTEWKGLIGTAELLFVRATGNTNRRTLFGPYEGQVLRMDDERLRGFPFSTRRATQAELMRSFIELTRVKVQEIDEAALAAAAVKAREEAEAADSAAAKQPHPAKHQPPEQSEEEAAAMLHTSQIIGLLRRSKAPALLSYLTTNSLSPDLRFQPPDSRAHHHAPTPLHMAASLNSSACVLALLTKAGADPTLVNAQGKTACDVAGDRATHDAFRIARSELGEHRWPWVEAGVGDALSRSDIEARNQRERQSEAQKAANEREQGLAKLREDEKKAQEEKKRLGIENREKKLGKPQMLNQGLEKTAQEKREEEMRGMTPEMRMRLERERRARAAEERMKRLQGGSGGGGR